VRDVQEAPNEDHNDDDVEVTINGAESHAPLFGKSAVAVDDGLQNLVDDLTDDDNHEDDGKRGGGDQTVDDVTQGMSMTTIVNESW
jgi:hypothetical protein